MLTALALFVTATTHDQVDASTIFRQLRIFNVTNAAEVHAGTQVPHVKEVGPFVFREVSRKWGLTWTSSATVGYRTVQQLQFAGKGGHPTQLLSIDAVVQRAEEMSRGSKTDSSAPAQHWSNGETAVVASVPLAAKVVVPNTQLLALMAKLRSQGVQTPHRLVRASLASRRVHALLEDKLPATVLPMLQSHLLEGVRRGEYNSARRRAVPEVLAAVYHNLRLDASTQLLMRAFARLRALMTPTVLQEHAPWLQVPTLSFGQRVSLFNHNNWFSPLTLTGFKAWSAAFTGFHPGLAALPHDPSVIAGRRARHAWYCSPELLLCWPWQYGDTAKLQQLAEALKLPVADAAIVAQFVVGYIDHTSVQKATSKAWSTGSLPSAAVEAEVAQWRLHNLFMAGEPGWPLQQSHNSPAMFALFPAPLPGSNGTAPVPIAVSSCHAMALWTPAHARAIVSAGPDLERESEPQGAAAWMAAEASAAAREQLQSAETWKRGQLPPSYRSSVPVGASCSMEEATVEAIAHWLHHDVYSSPAVHSYVQGLWASGDIAQDMGDTAVGSAARVPTAATATRVVQPVLATVRWCSASATVERFEEPPVALDAQHMAPSPPRRLGCPALGKSLQEEEVNWLRVASQIEGSFELRNTLVLQPVAASAAAAALVYIDPSASVDDSATRLGRYVVHNNTVADSDVACMTPGVAAMLWNASHPLSVLHEAGAAQWLLALGGGSDVAAAAAPTAQFVQLIEGAGGSASCAPGLIRAVGVWLRSWEHHPLVKQHAQWQWRHGVQGGAACGCCGWRVCDDTAASPATATDGDDPAPDATTVAWLFADALQPLPDTTAKRHGRLTSFTTQQGAMRWSAAAQCTPYVCSNSSEARCDLARLVGIASGAELPWEPVSQRPCCHGQSDSLQVELAQQLNSTADVVMRVAGSFVASTLQRGGCSLLRQQLQVERVEEAIGAELVNAAASRHVGFAPTVGLVPQAADQVAAFCARSAASSGVDMVVSHTCSPQHWDWTTAVPRLSSTDATVVAQALRLVSATHSTVDGGSSGQLFVPHSAGVLAASSLLAQPFATNAVGRLECGLVAAALEATFAGDFGDGGCVELDNGMWIEGFKLQPRLARDVAAFLAVHGDSEWSSQGGLFTSTTAGTVL